MTRQLWFCVPELYGFPEFVPHSARVRQAARVAFPRTRTAHEAQDEEPRFLEHVWGWCVCVWDDVMLAAAC